jgi:Amt family ammonium transporter
MTHLFPRIARGALAAFMLMLPTLAIAQDAAPVANSGDTAWMLTSSLLVLMMIIPGLALFYGGMVHKESVLAALMQSFVTCCLISVLWVLYGYSMVFSEGTGVFGNLVGSLDHLMLSNLTLTSLSGTIPESVFVMFQLTFAAITCALILGSVSNRIKFSSALAFMTLWFTFVYIPVAHWVWGPNGMLGGIGNPDAKGVLGFGTSLDFAGGLVVHVNSGIAGLVAALVIGAHKNFNKPDTAPKYNIVFSVIGASLLWVGWFGFNAGSAVTSGFNAGMAMLVTHISASLAALSWMLFEWMSRGKPSVIGIISGAVAGLVAITPASGFVDVSGAAIIGFLAGGVCFFACQLKHKMGYDDSLDVFGVHGVGGIVGALLTGLLAKEAIGGKVGSISQMIAQFEGIVITALWCGIATFVILKVIDAIMGLRVDETTENTGLDMAIHGERLH